MRRQLQETESRSPIWGECSRWTAKHISEVVEMTDGLIAGEGDAAEVLEVAANSRAAVNTNPGEKR
jgi:hypothetical protein